MEKQTELTQSQAMSPETTMVSSEGSSAGQITPLECAAITLLSMGEEPAASVLRCLSRQELLSVTQAMSRVNGVKVDVVQQTLQKFFDAYREQSSVHGASRPFLQRTLDKALGNAVASSVLNSIYGDAIGSKMMRLQWAQPQWLAERISREHVRMQALFMAFFPPEQACAVIDAMPLPRREMVLLHIARLKEVDHELLEDLESVVDACVQSLGTQSRTVEGVKQVAQIISRLSGSRSELMEMLRSQDPEVMALVEREIYDFSILTQQSDATITAIMEQVEMEKWALALKGADPALRTVLSRSMPRRQVQAFEDMLSRQGPVPVSRVEQTQREIMEHIRTMVEAGDIELQLGGEEVVS